jgi:tricorn protease
MNRTHIVFSYAGDLWSVPRQGGSAVRLTSGVGIENNPVFSPDGSAIAFTGEYDGNVDVYTVPSSGGVPTRVTHHPSPDYAIGWHPDWKRILFRSNRGSAARYTQLWTASSTGGPADALPLPMAFAGSYSPNGQRMAYAPLDGGQFGPTPERFVAWKRYRGGTASYLWTVNLSNLAVEKIPRADSNDINPMWVGDKIYFLSDRNGSMTLFRYDPGSKTVSELIRNTGHDLRSATAGTGGIVYEQFGEIHVYDFATSKSQLVPIQIAADLTEVRPRVQDVARKVQNAAISPTGARAVFEAHGEILTVPAEKGDIRNLTGTPGVMERTPAWSPDGQSVAYFSDESGEYALHVRQQTGAGETKKIPVAGNSAFYFSARWSPDSKQIAFSDNQLNLWRAEIATGRVVKVDTDYFYPYGAQEREIEWSPDSRWLAYSKFLSNRLQAIFVYSLDNAQSTRVTDDMSDARFPAFDRDGQYLYFTASTNFGPGSHPLDMTSDGHRVTRSVYALVLAADGASPVPPESDDEKAAEQNETKSADTQPKPVRIDLANFQARTVALPIPARDYQLLRTGKPGLIYLAEDVDQDPASRGAVLSKFDLKTRKLEKLADNVESFDLSANGEKMLLNLAGSSERGGAPGPWVIVSAIAPLKAGEGVLKLTGMEVTVDPRAEWKQMYREVWRIERSYFYDPALHGYDSKAAEKAYEPLLETLASREDLNYIFQEMLAEITSSHLRGGGGSVPRGKTVPGGLLGADFEIADGALPLQTHLYGRELES